MARIGQPKVFKLRIFSPHFAHILPTFRDSNCKQVRLRLFMWSTHKHTQSLHIVTYAVIKPWAPGAPARPARHIACKPRKPQAAHAVTPVSCDTKSGSWEIIHRTLKIYLKFTFYTNEMPFLCLYLLKWGVTWSFASNKRRNNHFSFDSKRLSFNYIVCISTHKKT